LHTLPQDVSKIRGKQLKLMSYRDGLSFARRVVSSLLPHQRAMPIRLYNTASARFLGVGNYPLASNLCHYLKSKPHVRILRRHQEDTALPADRRLAAKVGKCLGNTNTGARFTGESLSLPLQAPHQCQGAGVLSLHVEASRHNMPAVHVQRACVQQPCKHAEGAGRPQLECQAKSKGKKDERGEQKGEHGGHGGGEAAGLPRSPRPLPDIARLPPAQIVCSVPAA
jgi:hypothetical protein